MSSKKEFTTYFFLAEDTIVNGLISPRYGLSFFFKKLCSLLVTAIPIVQIDIVLFLLFPSPAIVGQNASTEC